MPDINFAALKANYQPISKEISIIIKGRIVLNKRPITHGLGSLNHEIRPFNTSDITSLINSVLPREIMVSEEGVFSFYLANLKINSNSDKILSLTLSDPKDNFRQTTVNLVLPAKTLDQAEVSIGKI